LIAFARVSAAGFATGCKSLFKKPAVRWRIVLVGQLHGKESLPQRLN
jgi:hypothetical protein